MANINPWHDVESELEGKKVVVLGIKDKDEAYKILERAKEFYRKKFGKKS